MRIEQRGADESGQKPQETGIRHGSGVVQACLIAAGAQATTLAALATALVNSGAAVAAVAVTVVMGILIAGTLVVAGIDVWRNGR